jgi:hypothetical protein
MMANVPVAPRARTASGAELSREKPKASRTLITAMLTSNGMPQTKRCPKAKTGLYLRLAQSRSIQPISARNIRRPPSVAVLQDAGDVRYWWKAEWQLSSQIAFRAQERCRSANARLRASDRRPVQLPLTTRNISRAPAPSSCLPPTASAAIAGVQRR